MKPIKIIFMLAAFVFIAFPAEAQDTTKPFYFPHKKGDMWQYFYDEYSPQYVDTLQNFTIFDSNGIIFIKQHAIRINPTGPSYFFYPDTVKCWIDTVNNYVYDNSRGNVLIYKLNAKKGEQWVMWDHAKTGGSGYDIARVTDKWKGTLFGKETTFMNIF